METRAFYALPWDYMDRKFHCVVRRLGNQIQMENWMETEICREMMSIFVVVPVVFAMAFGKCTRDSLRMYARNPRRFVV